MSLSIQTISLGREHTSPRPEVEETYTLIVLLRQWQGGGTAARVANLPIPEVQAATVREALSLLVAAAKELITENLARDNQIPWINPPATAEESESSVMVPLHL